MQDSSRKGRIAHGSRRPEAKLTDEKVLIARYAHSKGLMGVVELARLFGVHHVTMGHAIRGEQWSHVPMLEEDTNELQ
jgi:hypothetical protein